MTIICPGCGDKQTGGEFTDHTPDEPARAPQMGDIIICSSCTAVLIIWRDGSPVYLSESLQRVLPPRTRDLIAQAKRGIQH